MTDEQIKQSAEEYAEQNEVNFSEDKNFAVYDYDEQKEAYLAGAHSRDEEIEKLKDRLRFADESIADADKWIAKYKLDIANLEAKLEQLRNPWISVEDKLPKYYTVPSTEQYIKNIGCWDSKVAPTYIVVCSDLQGDYYQFANFLKFPEDKKPSWVFIEDNIKRNCITHWMPIPERKR